ncbi:MULTISPECIES: acyl dehydratase [unclassified Brevundimonas]|uniref:acyl dehydratase n=1 Tax=unclassified Brevundimonas TaxID=2622653 RepID=UPI0025C11009|nr:MULTISPECIES: acyl dehydratase [unclassified Brevundimonas]
MDEILSITFEQIEIGQVMSTGVIAVDQASLEVFVERFLPGWDEGYGAPDAMVYAIWSRLSHDVCNRWAGFKLLAVDGIRYLRNPPAGELLRGRITIMGKDPVGDAKGVVIAQQDLLDEAGRLVFSCLTRALVTRQ